MFFKDEIHRWLGAELKRPDGTTAKLHTKYASIKRGVERELARDLNEILGNKKRVVIVCDERTGKYVEAVERALRDKAFVTSLYTVPDGEGGESPVADDALAEKVQKAMADAQADGAVAVGAGTINDLTKFAASQLNIPYVVYGTAASMNGYNSPIAALYVKGLKSSVPARPAIGIYADPEVLASAPRHLHLAGLGDLCSKPFAGADAVISALIHRRPPWHLPTEIVSEAFEKVLENAEAIGKDDPEAIAMLMEALWISGFSMALAGTSAPASGGEHLWSHRIDMMRHDAGLPPLALHGTQVGVGCILVRELFQKALEFDSADVQKALQKPLASPSEEEYKNLKKWIDERHSDLKEPSRSAILAQAEKKYNIDFRKTLRKGLLESWEQISEELKRAKAHADMVLEALNRAQAPTSPEELGLKTEQSDRILNICKDIRNRFTILDLVTELSIPIA